MKRTKADIAWAAAVKERDNYTCRRCQRYFPEGARRGLDAHHIFTRSRRSTRWDVDNGVSLCTGDHISWAHRNPLEFHEWIRDVLGWKDYDALQARSRQMVKA